MLGAARLSLVPALVAAWLLLPATANAIVPQVRDGGKFLKDETIKKADIILLDIQKNHNKDVVVETFDKIPAEVLQRIKYDPNNRKSFFAQWAREIASKGKVNGIIILISKDQNHNNSTWIEEEVGENTREKAFKDADRVELHDKFTNTWSKDHNAALLEGLNFINTRMAAHHNAAPKTGVAAVQAPNRSGVNNNATSADGGSNILAWVCIGFCVLVGIWLIVGLFRAFSGGGGGGYAGGPGYGGGYGGGGGGGGGFMTGLMGGLFGAMAGNWIYNNMFGGSSHHGGFESSARAGDTPAGGRDDFGPSDQGQGFSGGGGDVDGGGGDVDSGDAGGGGGDAGGGGGDWGGGGDAGGGGGDWGGGGGDWGGGGGGGGGGDFGGGGGGGGGDW